MSTLSGTAIIAAIKRAGVEFVVALPDIVTSEGLLWPLSRDKELRLVRVCKEDEGVAICMGLAVAGRRSILLIQQTGFLDSINAIRGIAVEYEQPVVMMIGLQGKEPDRKPSESAKFAVRIVEPMIDVMGIRRDVLDDDADVARVAPAIESAYRDSRPVCLLIGRTVSP
jgi:sulfopyruvate decarboxylase TPP-binding subunit